MLLSASRMRRWMACPLQVKLSEEFEVEERQHAKTSFGTIIHAALEHYNKEGFNLKESQELFIFLWDHPEEIQLPLVDAWIFGKGTNYGGLRDRGLQILEEYNEKQKWENRIVLSTEHAFVVPFGEHFLRGFVDLIEIKKGAKGIPVIRIIDFKSTARQPTINELRFDIQLTSYIYASLQKEFWIGNPEFNIEGLDNGESLYYDYIKYPRRAIWYHLWGNKEIDGGPREDEDFLRLYRLACSIAEAEEKKVFMPNISADSCNFCDYVEHCGVMMPVKDKINQNINEDD